MRGIGWILAILVALCIPAMVLAGGGTGRIAAHGGLSGLRLAEFEHFSGVVDSEELNRRIEQKLGSGWERIVRDTRRRGKVQTLIFGHLEGNRLGLFVLDLDGERLSVVQLSVDPDHLADSVGRTRHPS